MEYEQTFGSCDDVDNVTLSGEAGLHKIDALSKIFYRYSMISSLFFGKKGEKLRNCKVRVKWNCNSM